MHLPRWTTALALFALTAPFLSACGAKSDTSVLTIDDAWTDTTAVADTATDVGGGAKAEDWRVDGPHPVGHQDFVLTDAKRGRTLRVTLWYPAVDAAKAAADKGASLADFYPVDSPEHATLTTLLAKAPACVRPQTHSAPGAAPWGEKWPLVAFSHCHTCMRFESTTIMERLASHGIAVIAPDHTGNTVFEGLAGTSAQLGTAFLEVRAGDIRFVVDQILDPQNPAIPEALRGKINPDLIAALGHSFGGVTTGKVIQDDPRFKSGFALAVPMAQPLLQGVDMANIHVPTGFVLAREDNSIMDIGNSFILQDFAEAHPPVWLLQVADAGHFSFADVAGLTDFFSAGCGQGERMADQTPFTYLDNATARGLAARIVGAFFGRTLLGEATAEEPLMAVEPAGVVSATERL